MTQQQVADLLGITRQAYNHYESERRKPDTNTLRAIADVFGCSIDELLDYAPANSYPVGKMSAGAHPGQRARGLQPAGQ